MHRPKLFQWVISCYMTPLHYRDGSPPYHSATRWTRWSAKDLLLNHFLGARDTCEIRDEADNVVERYKGSPPPPPPLPIPAPPPVEDRAA